MTQKRDRIVAWAIRKDAVAKVTARLRYDEPRPALSLRALARGSFAEWYGDQFDQAVFTALTNPASQPFVPNRIGALDVVEP